jgi:hypothetical protein
MTISTTNAQATISNQPLDVATGRDNGPACTQFPESTCYPKDLGAHTRNMIAIDCVPFAAFIEVWNYRHTSGYTCWCVKCS